MRLAHPADAVGAGRDRADPPAAAPEPHQRFLRMPDGRRIEVLSFGDPAGRPVIWMQSTYGFWRLPRAAEADFARRRLQGDGAVPRRLVRQRPGAARAQPVRARRRRHAGADGAAPHRLRRGGGARRRHPHRADAGAGRPGAGARDLRHRLRLPDPHRRPVPPPDPGRALRARLRPLQPARCCRSCSAACARRSRATGSSATCAARWRHPGDGSGSRRRLRGQRDHRLRPASSGRHRPAGRAVLRRLGGWTGRRHGLRHPRPAIQGRRDARRRQRLPDQQHDSVGAAQSGGRDAPRWSRDRHLGRQQPVLRAPPGPRFRAQILVAANRDPSIVSDGGGDTAARARIPRTSASSPSSARPIPTCRPSP